MAFSVRVTGGPEDVGIDEAGLYEVSATTPVEAAFRIFTELFETTAEVVELERVGVAGLSATIVRLSPSGSAWTAIVEVDEAAKSR